VERQRQGTFCRCGEAVVGRGDGRPNGSQWCAIKEPVKEEEVTGQQRFMGELKRSQCHIGSRAQRVARAPDAVAVAKIGIGGGTLAARGGRQLRVASWAVGHVGPGEEGGCSGPRWTKRSGGLGALMG
jgi:hypothetical protein